jgi:hypothetical protein
MIEKKDLIEIAGNIENPGQKAKRSLGIIYMKDETFLKIYETELIRDGMTIYYTKSNYIYYKMHMINKILEFYGVEGIQFSKDSDIDTDTIYLEYLNGGDIYNLTLCNYNGIFRIQDIASVIDQLRKDGYSQD